MHAAIVKILEVITVFFFSGIKYILGIFNATVLFKLGFFPSVLVTILGGMAGVFLFALIDRAALKVYHKLVKKPEKVKFNKRKRWIVRVKSNYGLLGIAFLTPLILQVPLGTIIAMRLIKDLKKVSLAMLLSFSFYSLLLCGTYYGLTGHFREILMSFVH